MYPVKILELQTKVREDFTITEKAPKTKEPNLLRHYAKQLSNSK